MSRPTNRIRSTNATTYYRKHPRTLTKLGSSMINSESRHEEASRILEDVPMFTTRLASVFTPDSLEPNCSPAALQGVNAELESERESERESLKPGPIDFQPLKREFDQPSLEAGLKYSPRLVLPDQSSQFSENPTPGNSRPSQSPARPTSRASSIAFNPPRLPTLTSKKLLVLPRNTLKSPVRSPRKSPVLSAPTSTKTTTSATSLPSLSCNSTRFELPVLTSRPAPPVHRPGLNTPKSELTFAAAARAFKRPLPDVPELSAKKIKK